MKTEKPKRPYRTPHQVLVDDGTFRLNKFVANAGVCSRREADKLIAAGQVKVNGVVITEMGHKVSLRDKVEYNNKPIFAETKRYVLLNKPKGFVTTVKDEKDRKTVMDLVKKACDERIYPVGRLDIATTGLLLLTNDGDLAKRMMHPSFGVRKTYHVQLDKEFSLEHFTILKNTGVTLEEGIAKPDELSWVGEGEDKTQLGVSIHIGWNKVVRRMFQELGYEVVRLDRVLFGPLTKKNLPRGNWRLLDVKEVNLLKRVTRNLDNIKEEAKEELLPKFQRKENSRERTKPKRKTSSRKSFNKR